MINLAITRMENAPRTRSRKILLRMVIRFISRYLTNTFPNPRFKIIHDYFTRILFQKYLQKQQQSIYIYDRCFVHILRNLEISNFLYTYIISFFIPQWNSTRRNGVIPIKTAFHRCFRSKTKETYSPTRGRAVRIGFVQGAPLIRAKKIPCSREQRGFSKFHSAAPLRRRVIKYFKSSTRYSMEWNLSNLNSIFII